MTATLFTAVFLSTLAMVAVAAVSTPVDAEGRKVPRSKRTLWGDLRALTR